MNLHYLLAEIAQKIQEGKLAFSLNNAVPHFPKGTEAWQR
jgi:hypothetical protein